MGMYAGRSVAMPMLVDEIGAPQKFGIAKNFFRRAFCSQAPAIEQRIRHKIHAPDLIHRGYKMLWPA